MQTATAVGGLAIGFWLTPFPGGLAIGSHAGFAIDAGFDALAFLVALSITAVGVTLNTRGMAATLTVTLKALMLTAAIGATQSVQMRALQLPKPQYCNVALVCLAFLAGYGLLTCSVASTQQNRPRRAVAALTLAVIAMHALMVASTLFAADGDDLAIRTQSPGIVAQPLLCGVVASASLLVLLASVWASRWDRCGRLHDVKEAQRFRHLAATTFDGLIREKYGRIVDANQAMHDLAGLAPRALYGVALSAVIPDLELCAAAGGESAEYAVLQPDESRRPVEVIHHRTESKGGHFIAVRDLARQKAAESLIERLANRDPLTDLLNRGAFERLVQRAIESAAHQGGRIAILHIGIDRFELLIELLGTSTADLVLIQVAQRLSRAIRQTDTLGRVGRDEFSVLQATKGTSIDASALAERILKSVEPPFQAADQVVIINVSIGVAFYPSDGPTARELIRNAALATRHARLDGRCTWRHFESSMDQRARLRQMMQRDLRQALRNNQLSLDYQPFFDATTLEIAGYEALLRWNHPVRGPVSPDDFIPSAEESGLIVAIGSWALQTACAEAVSWPHSMVIAVNLSPAQVEQPSVVGTISEILQRTGLPAAQLELEVTETTLLDNKDSALQTLTALKALGVKLAMDDFGTGYSSLNYLRMFPFDKIKIDRSFINDCDRNSDAKSIVQSIVAMGTALHLRITAEGIETTEQLALLQEYGCSYLQGYLLGRPSPVAMHMQTADAAAYSDDL